MINRSTTRDIPHFPVARYEVAVLFGTLVAETILASVHVRAHQQAGHMDASDLIKLLQNTLRGGDRPHMENQGVPIEIGESGEPIPVYFAYRHDISREAGFTDSPPDRLLRDVFDVPDLATMDDAIVNGTLARPPGAPAPLALFRAASVDYSLHRLYHYTGTDPDYFQNFVIFTNYQFYVDAFARICRERVAVAGGAGGIAFVEPGDVVTRLGDAAPVGTPPERGPQMPAFHLVEPDHSGITMINIGPGPSNARNITDHVAVMRPYAWLMLGQSYSRNWVMAM